MTFAEINRAIASHNRLKNAELQQKASYDYILANLIGRSVARVFNSNATYPDIGEVYPTLFDSETIKQQKLEQKMEISALRFKQFTQSYNKKFQGGVKD